MCKSLHQPNNLQALMHLLDFLLHMLSYHYKLIPKALFNRLLR